jgi:hypothetical protein
LTQWAVVKNNTAENIIIADTQQIAEEVSGKSVIELKDTDIISIGWNFDNGVWYAPKPTDGNEYTWDTGSMSWVLLIA